MGRGYCFRLRNYVTLYTFRHRHCTQCAKNQYHTANTSTGRHAAGASYLCGEHQIERGLHDCLPSIAGRSCSSLLPLRQARIVGGLSGLIWTQVDRSGQRLRQLSYLCTVFKTHREYWQRLGIEKGPFLCTRLAQYLHSQSGMTKALAGKMLGGADFSPRRRCRRPPKQRSTAEGKVNPL